VRQFIGNPTADLVASGPYADDPLTSRLGLHYTVVTPEYPATGGAFAVRATDGKVLSMQLRFPDGATIPKLSLQEARAIAEDFARRHYPPFAQFQWVPAPAFSNGNQGTYIFIWYRVLNAYGVLAPMGTDLEVRVDGITGQVFSYLAPMDIPIMAPLVPRIPLEQAKQIAAPFAALDLAQVPFNLAYLQISQDSFGVQRLEWHISQQPRPVTDPELHYDVWVDALTGEVTGLPGGFLGGAPGARRRTLPPLPQKKQISLRSREGKLLHSYAAPVLKAGRLWIRAELLRGLGARVEADPKSVVIQVGNRRLAGKEVGARWQDYGWWVPLGKVAQKLGWQVSWHPRTQDAVVDSRAATPQAPVSASHS
jgi:hypothetical protein